MLLVVKYEKYTWKYSLFGDEDFTTHVETDSKTVLA